MTQREINRIAEMEVFVAVVEQSGLSAAARERRMTPSAVSKLVSRLEARLGTQLLARSTRRLRLTPEGDLFYQHARRILADIEEAERAVASGEEATGRVRLNTSASFNMHTLDPSAALSCFGSFRNRTVFPRTLSDPSSNQRSRERASRQ